MTARKGRIVRRSPIFQCDECGICVPETAILTVYIPHPKPGRDNVAVQQCPECGSVNEWTNMCDEPECDRPASCGWPTKSGDYRRTCGEHMNSNAHERAADYVKWAREALAKATQVTTD